MASMFPTRPQAGSREQWTAWAYPIYSIWIRGPLILLALIFASVANERKSLRQPLATTVVVLSATFPPLAALVLAA